MPAIAAHRAPCQRRSSKSSSKAARAQSQNKTALPAVNASRNRLHHCQGRGKFGAEQIAEAAALIATAAPRRATVLSRRSRSPTAAISSDNPTVAPRKPRSSDKKPLLATTENTPDDFVDATPYASRPLLKLRRRNICTSSFNPPSGRGTQNRDRT
ncbi:hypothetical protein [Bradyrhizobium sp. OAE829]|uniref:hypothetical protein n=1 Tax=Bradyrhizobium sp. OAE829 TaxID=2663807 RepID=UPI001A091B06